MAREYAQIKLSVWADDDWREVPAAARYLYLSLLTSPTLTHCGVADWRPARLGPVIGMTTDEVEEAGADLVDLLYVLIDAESEEVVIRSFLRNDGLMKQPKMAVAMASAHAAVASTIIRGVIVHELQRLREDNPTLSGWGAERATDLLGLRSVDPSTYPLGKGCRKGKQTPFGKGSGKGSPTPAPTPTPNTSSLTDVADSAEGQSGRSATDATNARALVLVNDRPDVARLCDHLADRIADDGSNRPTITKGWLDAARLMLDKDGRSEEEAHAAIDWCQDSDFWSPNVLSMPTLRQKYDQLRKQAIADRERAARPGGGSRNSEFQAQQERAMARAEERERQMGIRT